MVKISLLKDRNSQEYYKFIQSIDADFYPKLSERKGGIRRFIDKVYDEEGDVHIATRDRLIVGSISYWITGQNDIYAWLIVVIPQLRGLSVGRKVIFSLIENAILTLKSKNKGLRYLEFTTWENNKAARKLYQILDCHLYQIIENDMVNGRTTYHYRTPFQKFCDNFARLNG